MRFYYAYVGYGEWALRARPVYRFVCCLRVPLFVHGWRNNLEMATREYGKLILRIVGSRWRFNAYTYIATPEKSISMKEMESGNV